MIKILSNIVIHLNLRSSRQVNLGDFYYKRKIFWAWIEYRASCQGLEYADTIHCHLYSMMMVSSSSRRLMAVLVIGVPLKE
ncbi:hypothetical protein ACOSP7_001189 [Xanthoceras sorbifolium]